MSNIVGSKLAFNAILGCFIVPDGHDPGIVDKSVDRVGNSLDLLCCFTDR